MASALFLLPNIFTFHFHPKIWVAVQRDVNGLTLMDVSDPNRVRTMQQFIGEIFSVKQEKRELSWSF